MRPTALLGVMPKTLVGRETEEGWQWVPLSTLFIILAICL